MQNLREFAFVLGSSFVIRICGLIYHSLVIRAFIHSTTVTNVRSVANLFLRFLPRHGCSRAMMSSTSRQINRYVPVHLEYILTEILKNSYRATAERRPPGASGHSLPPVQVTISLSADHLSLRIRDEGGGIPPAHFPNVFSYAFTTARSSASDGEDDESGGGPYAAQHIGGAAAIGGGGDGDSVNLGMFGEITAAGVQSGMGTIAGFGYG